VVMEGCIAATPAQSHGAQEHHGPYQCGAAIRVGCIPSREHLSTSS
jgi:hypothetical protein